jgi:cytoskeletal protein CcmA (bactofilin family)
VGVFSKSESDRDDKGLNVDRGDIKPGAKATSGKTLAETVSVLGHGMVVTGDIVCENTVQIFGRVDGDIHAAQLVVKEGAQVEGNVVARETIILGVCKGVIYGNSVKLQGTAVVEGEIFSKSLTIEDRAQFEGVSRRLDKPVEAPSSAQVSMPTGIPLAPAMTETGQADAMAETMNA